jgi:aryl-alcohol dehydrogenase-like predicted oxidoreductase
VHARTLGRTGLRASALGLGAGPLGDFAFDDAQALSLIHQALELGVTLIDTAPSYGCSEDRLGRALQGRREQITLVTKGGYGVEGVADWTPEAVTKSCERALQRLRTDRVDVFLLHSCDAPTFARVLDALVALKRDGKARAVGYSGDGAALDAAIDSRALDVIECSVSVFDQAALSRAVPRAAEQGLGVLAKRAMGGAVWRFPTRPERTDLAQYWDRMRAMPAHDWPALALRFAAFAPGVSCALAGTCDAGHLRAHAQAVGAGPLDEARVAGVRGGFDPAWPGVI